MRSWTLALALAALCCAQPNQLTPVEKAQGFDLLFDGHSSAGWLEITGDGFPASWKIEDGALKPVAGLLGFQDIRTVGEYRDFELRFEWRISRGGNSGVKYLLDKVDRWIPKGVAAYHARARGFEYQIVDDALNEDALANPKNTAGALYSKLAPSTAAAHAPGEWNESRIIVQGAHVEHWLNGTKVIDCECAAGRGPAATPVSLQNHNSDAWFRSLRILRFP